MRIGLLIPMLVGADGQRIAVCGGKQQSVPSTRRQHTGTLSVPVTRAVGSSLCGDEAPLAANLGDFASAISVGLA